MLPYLSAKTCTRDREVETVRLVQPSAHNGVAPGSFRLEEPELFEKQFSLSSVWIYGFQFLQEFISIVVRNLWYERNDRFALSKGGSEFRILSQSIGLLSEVEGALRPLEHESLRQPFVDTVTTIRLC